MKKLASTNISTSTWTDLLLLVLEETIYFIVIIKSNYYLYSFIQQLLPSTAREKDNFHKHFSNISRHCNRTKNWNTFRTPSQSHTFAQYVLSETFFKISTVRNTIGKLCSIKKKQNNILLYCDLNHNLCNFYF